MIATSLLMNPIVIGVQYNVQRSLLYATSISKGGDGREIYLLAINSRSFDADPEWY